MEDRPTCSWGFRGRAHRPLTSLTCWWHHCWASRSACCWLLGGANGVAILPFTFSMNPTSAIIMLSCIYWGALFGGITSILFNIPGELWSVATTLTVSRWRSRPVRAQALTAAFTRPFARRLRGGGADHLSRPGSLFAFAWPSSPRKVLTFSSFAEGARSR